MEKTFTVSLDQAKEWLASFAKQAISLPISLPPWLLTAMAFVPQLEGRKQIEVTVRVVDD